jgi:hypothetical protein
MKYFLRLYWLAGCLFLLMTACSSVKTVTLEIQEPASITLPVTTQNVVVLNNAGIQPSNQSVFRQYKRESYQAHPVEFDTMAWVAVYTIADVLSESGFFENIEVYTRPIREDNDFLTQNNLGEDILTDFLTDLDYDMIISVDRLVLSINEIVHPVIIGDDKGIKNVNLTTHGLLSCGIYTKNGQSSPLTTFNMLDSLVYNSFIEGDSVEIFKSLPESLGRVLAVFLAETTAGSFIPSWTRTERVLFTSANARMKEAYRYAGAEKWNEAVVIWKSLLERKNKAIDNAKLSSNLAVAYEMKADFSEALRWAEQSQAYYKEVGSSVPPKELERIQGYVTALEKRIKDNRILDMQLGI